MDSFLAQYAAVLMTATAMLTRSSMNFDYGAYYGYAGIFLSMLFVYFWGAFLPRPSGRGYNQLWKRFSGWTADCPDFLCLLRIGLDARLRNLDA
jgi:hypothetical protein